MPVWSMEYGVWGGGGREGLEMRVLEERVGEGGRERDGGRGYPIGQSGGIEVGFVVREDEGGGLKGGGHAREGDDEDNAANDLGRHKCL